MFFFQLCQTMVRNSQLTLTTTKTIRNLSITIIQDTLFLLGAASEHLFPALETHDGWKKIYITVTNASKTNRVKRKRNTFESSSMQLLSAGFSTWLFSLGCVCVLVISESFFLTNFAMDLFITIFSPPTLVNFM